MVWNASGLHSQRYDSAGRAWGPAEQVAGPFCPWDKPAVAGLRNGGYTVAWSCGAIYMRSYDAAGRPNSDPNQLETPQADSVAVAGLQSGGHVIAWREYSWSDGTSLPDLELQSQRFDEDGTAIGGRTRVNATTLGQLSAPSLAALADGGHVVAWSSATSDWSRTNIYTQRFDSAGVAIGGETLVSAGTYAYSARIAALADGGWIVAWTGSPAGGRAGIYTRRYSGDGVPAGAEVPVTTGTWYAPEIAALEDGGYLVVWVVTRLTVIYVEGQPYEYPVGDLHARRFDGTAAAVGGEMVFPTSSNEREPALAGLSHGGFAVAWRADNDPRYPGDIYVRVFHDALVGAEGSDWLQAGDRIRVLLGAGGQDRLLGSAGHDWLDGGPGDDFMAAGAGHDTYLVDSDKDKVLEHPGEGHDTVKSSIDHALAHGVEDLVLTGGDPINGYGNKQDNVIIGNAAANRLSGGLGSDSLEGGGGADTFVFDTRPAADNVDLVKRFNAAEDTVELAASIFRKLPGGRLGAAAFAIGSAASAETHRIVFDPAAKALMYDADGAGGAAPVQFASLEDLLGNLTAANFVVR